MVYFLYISMEINFVFKENNKLYINKIITLLDIIKLQATSTCIQYLLIGG